MKKIQDQIIRYGAISGGLVGIYQGMELAISNVKGKATAEAYQKELADTVIKLNKVQAELDLKNKEALLKLIDDESSNLVADQIKTGISARAGTILEQTDASVSTLRRNIENIEKQISELLKNSKVEEDSDISGSIYQLSKHAFETGKKDLEKIDTLSKELVEFVGKNMGGKDNNLISQVFSEYQAYLNSLSPEQMIALGHVLLCIGILSCLISMIFVFSGDKLIIHFKLEERYPRLAKFISLRRKFQNYTFYYNALIIVLLLLFIMYANIRIFVVYL